MGQFKQCITSKSRTQSETLNILLLKMMYEAQNDTQTYGKLWMHKPGFNPWSLWDNIYLMTWNLSI